jgi:hypothetical protein
MKSRLDYYEGGLTDLSNRPSYAVQSCLHKIWRLSEAYEKLTEWGWGMAFVQLSALVFLFPVRVFWVCLSSIMGLRLWLRLFRVFYSPCALCCCFGWSTCVDPVGWAVWLDDDYDDGGEDSTFSACCAEVTFVITNHELHCIQGIEGRTRIEYFRKSKYKKQNHLTYAHVIPISLARLILGKANSFDKEPGLWILVNLHFFFVVQI